MDGALHTSFGTDWSLEVLPAPEGTHSPRSQSAEDRCTLLLPVNLDRRFLDYARLHLSVTVNQSGIQFDEIVKSAFAITLM